MNDNYDDFSQDELLLRRVFEIHAAIIALQLYPEFKRSLHRKSIIDYLRDADIAVQKLYERVKFCVEPESDSYLDSIRKLCFEIDKHKYSIPKNLQNN